MSEIIITLLVCTKYLSYRPRSHLQLNCEGLCRGCFRWSHDLYYASGVKCSTLEVKAIHMELNWATGRTHKFHWFSFLFRFFFCQTYYSLVLRNGTTSTYGGIHQSMAEWRISEYLHIGYGSQTYLCITGMPEKMRIWISDVYLLSVSLMQYTWWFW